MINWEEYLQKYIIKHSNRINSTTQPLKDHFGINHTSYHRIDNTGNYSVLGDHPEWAEHYVSKQIFLTDPYLRHPSVYQSGIGLIENHGSNFLLKEAKEFLNMGTGVILIQKNDTYVEFFRFYGNNATSSLQSLYLNRPQLLKSFATHFKKELKKILIQIENEFISLSALKGNDFFCNLPIYPDVSSTSLLAYYKDLGMKCEFEKAEKLSSRERQCLKLLIEEKSAKETAAILGLSSRTIEYYFENIKDKLSCWGKKELLVIARTFEDAGLL